MTKEVLLSSIKEHIDFGNAILKGQEDIGIYKEPFMIPNRLYNLWKAYRNWRKQYDKIVEEMQAMGEDVNFPSKTAENEEAYFTTFHGEYDICREIRNALQEHIKELNDWQIKK